MRRVPPLLLTSGLVLAAAVGCRPSADSDLDGGDSLPFAETPIPSQTLHLAAGSDTLVLRVASQDGTLRIARYRRVVGGIDSAGAIVDPVTKRPITSFQRVHTPDGSITAEVQYGRGFDGQARRRMTSPEGSREDNLRTPPPVLDAAQIPIVFGALDLTKQDTVSFNFVAPFEKRALPARVEVGGERRLRLGDETLRALSVRLRVSGLEERYWFSTEPPHRLLRLDEITRNVTWTRP